MRHCLKKLLHHYALSQIFDKCLLKKSLYNIIRKYFLPTKDEILEAKEIINLYKKSNNGVFSYKGKVIDKPIIKIMENKLIISGNN